MKRNFEKPIAKRVDFSYEKVTAASGQNCYWGRYEEGAGCHSSHDPNEKASRAAVPECGWIPGYEKE